MSKPARVVTAVDLAQMRDDQVRYELGAGHLIEMSPVGGVHGVLTARLGAALTAWAERDARGVVMTGCGFVLSRDPDTVRAPDLAFVRRDRVHADGVPSGFWPGPPDAAVEIASPGDRQSELRAKAAEYLRRGVALVWIVDPSARTVTEFRPSTVPRLLDGDQTLDASDLLPGFAYPLRTLFRAGPS
jgi:Uma2 family endonuclease